MTIHKNKNQDLTAKIDKKSVHTYHVKYRNEFSLINIVPLLLIWTSIVWLSNEVCYPLKSLGDQLAHGEYYGAQYEQPP